PFHDEAVRRRSVLVRRRDLTGSHRLHPAEEPTADRCIFPPRVAVVEESDNAPTRFFGFDELDRPKTHGAHLGISPQGGAVARLGFPRLDRISTFPEGAGVAHRKLAIKGFEFRGIGDARAPEHIVAGIDNEFRGHDGISSSGSLASALSTKKAGARGVR